MIGASDIAVRAALNLLVGQIAASAPRPLVDGRVRVGDIVRDVAWHTGLKRDDIIGPGRDKVHFRARAAVCWLAMDCMIASLSQIGAVLGGRDHSTILAAGRRGADMRERDPAFRMLTDILRRKYRDMKEH